MRASMKCSRYEKKCLRTQLNVQGTHKLCAGYMKYFRVTTYNFRGYVKYLRIFYTLRQA